MVLNSRGLGRAGRGETFTPLFLLFPEQVIQAPGTGAGGNQPQIEEAKDHGFFATVINGPEAAWRPTPEIGYGHFAAEEERGRAGEQPQENEGTPGNFQWSRESVQRSEAVIDPSSRKAPQLLGSMLEKQESDGHTQQTQQIWCPFGSGF